MTKNEIRERLLDLARVRLNERFGAFEQFRFQLDTSITGSAILHRAMLMPAAWVVGLEMGLEAAPKQIDLHILGLIDEWAQTHAPVQQIQALEGIRQTPAQTATPAPVVAVVALVEPDKAGPVVCGLLTKEIAAIFDGLMGWDAERWPKNLSGSQWLHPARTALGGAGVASAVWNPLTLAQLMHEKTNGLKPKEQLMKALYSRFNRNSALVPWRDDFNEYFATYCTTD